MIMCKYKFVFCIYAHSYIHDKAWTLVKDTQHNTTQHNTTQHRCQGSHFKQNELPRDLAYIPGLSLSTAEDGDTCGKLSASGVDSACK